VPKLKVKVDLLRHLLDADSPAIADRPPFSLLEVAAKPSRLSLIASVAFHVCLFLVVIPVSSRFWSQMLEENDPRDPELVALMDLKDKKVLWYRFPKEMPRVSPQNANATNEFARAREKATKQEIVAQAPNPESEKQNVFMADLSKLLKRDVPAPNLIAMAPPTVQPKLEAPSPTELAKLLPKMERLKAEIRPNADAPSAMKMNMDAAPEMAVRTPTPAGPVNNPQLDKIPRLAFKPTERQSQAKLNLPAMESAPDVQSERGLPVASRAGDNRLPGLDQVKRLAWQPPANPSRTGRGNSANMEQAPEVSSTDGLARNGSAMTGLSRLEGTNVKRLAAVLPSGARTGSNTGNGRTTIEEAPAVTNMNGNGNLRAAILNADATQVLKQIPSGNRAGSLSRAQMIGDPDAGRENLGKGIGVPNVMVGSHANPKLPVTSMPIVQPPDEFIEINQDISWRATLSVGLQPAIRAVPRFVDTQFTNQDIYTIVIPMKNAARYTGDWIMWFTRLAGEKGRSAEKVTAPLPVRKMESRRELATVEGSRAERRVLMSAIVRSSGSIDHATPLRQMDPALARMAMDDLLRWTFQPATLNGQPVDAQMILEIPLRMPRMDGNAN
jgi:hypothetical protein